MYHLQKSVHNSGVTLSGFKEHYGASKLPSENLIMLLNVPLHRGNKKNFVICVQLESGIGFSDKQKMVLRPSSAIIRCN